MSGSLADAAAALARRGWHVFPIIRKRPATEHGLLDATADPERAYRMFGPRITGIGVNCGRSGLLVADVDGPDAAREWAKLVAEHGCPETLEVTTGRTDGGTHYYFATRDERAATGAGQIAPGIDTRGLGGYTIVPPSRHSTGRLYAWATRRPPAPAPEWLLVRLDKGEPPPVGERAELPPGELATNYGRAALDGLVDQMRSEPEGYRNHRFVRVAYRAGRLVAAGELHEALAERDLKDAALAAGLSPGEIKLTWISGFGAGLDKPAVRAPRQHAQRSTSR